MEAKGLAWLGTKTRRFEETAGFFGKTMGLKKEHEEPDFAVFKLPNGDTVEVFGPGERGHDHFSTGPVVGFLVDDVSGARMELEDAGIAFIGPVHTHEDGGSWSHFLGPDGNAYELTGDR